MAPVLELFSLGLSFTDRLGRVLAALGLDTGLLVDREHDGVLRGVQVKPTDVGSTFPELWRLAPGQPPLDAVGLDVVGGKDATDLGGRDPDPRCSHCHVELKVAPLCIDDGVLLGHLGHEHETFRRAVNERTPRTRCVDEPVDAEFKEPPSPLADRLLGETDAWCDFGARDAVRAQKDHLGSHAVTM